MKTGAVRGTPTRYLYRHYQRRSDPLVQYREEDRGFERPCRIWTGAVSTHQGYGTYAGRYAHVLAFEAAHGAVPRGFVVHHRCEQKLCVRGDHLEAVRRSQHPSLHVKVDAGLFDEIQAAPGTTRQVAAQYGISKTHAWMIRSGKQPRPIP